MKLRNELKELRSTLENFKEKEDNLKDKSEDRTEYRPDDRPEDKPEDKLDDKSEEKSDQRNFHKEIREERDFFLKIFNSFQDGVYIVDENENIQYVNPVLEKEFGSWEGKKCYAYFHGGKQRCSFCKIDQVFSGEVVHWEWYSKKNKKTYDLLDTLIILSDGTITSNSFREVPDISLNAHSRLLQYGI